MLFRGDPSGFLELFELLLQCSKARHKISFDDLNEFDVDG